MPPSGKTRPGMMHLPTVALSGVLLLFLLLSGCGYYIQVEHGDTLNSIAKKYDLTVNDMLEANPDIKDPDKIIIGQKLKVPREKSLVASEIAKEEESPRKTEKAKTVKKEKTEKPQAKAKDVKNNTANPPSNTAKMQQEPEKIVDMNFAWPVNGSIIRNFGKGSDGRLSEGIDISATAGQKVLAAADGEVIVADDRLKGYGNMVVIQHANKYVTIYAHNRVNHVKKGDKVKQGQMIAEVGNTGRADNPILHFEIRKGINCIDPVQYLPKK
jgi:murein DD-endopeptidase MepM/ murein hydrolase activator NlpD